MDLTALVLLIVFITTHDMVSCSHCTSEELGRCLEVRNQYLEGEGYNISSLSLYMLEEEHLDQFCRLHQSHVQDCLLSMAKHCDDTSAAWILGIDDSYIFLCEEQFDEFLDFKDCLRDDTIRGNLEICTDQFERKVSFANQLPDSMNKDLCPSYEEFIDCEADEVSFGCGADAGKWTRTYNNRLYRPYLEHIGCFDGTTEAPQTPGGLPLLVIVGIAIGAVILIAVLIAIVLCVCRHLLDEQKDQPVQPPPQHLDLQQAAPVIHVEPGGKLTLQTNQWHHDGPQTANNRDQEPQGGQSRSNPPAKKHKRPAKSDHRHRNRHFEQDFSSFDAGEYLTPVPSVHNREDSVRYHMDPIRQYRNPPPSYSSMPAGEALEYSNGSPPPSYTSQPEGDYTKLTNNARITTAGNAPRGATPKLQDYRNDAYEELPDITDK